MDLLGELLYLLIEFLYLLPVKRWRRRRYVREGVSKELLDAAILARGAVASGSADSVSSQLLYRIDRELRLERELRVFALAYAIHGPFLIGSRARLGRGWKELEATLSEALVAHSGNRSDARRSLEDRLEGDPGFRSELYRWAIEEILATLPRR
jgi:hypothetical protein